MQGLDDALQFYPNTFYDFTVIGAGTTNPNPNEGDVKWVPLYWSTAANPTAKQQHTAWKIGSTKGIKKADTYNLYVFFQKYVYTNGNWQPLDTIESAVYQFKSAELTPAGTPGADGTDGQNGEPGQNGATFTPSVSTDGVLSWTNDGGKENPASVNVKGPAGAPGKDGSAGAPGADGEPGQDGTTFTPSVSADGILSWTNDGGKENPASVNIKGPAGEAGPGSELFYVGCGIHAKDTYDQSVTHTKTYDEILAAYKAGKACYARVKLFGAYNTNLLLLPLAEVDEAFGYVDFALTKMVQGDAPEELMICYVHIDSEGNAEGYYGTRYTLSGSEKFLPSVTAADNGKFMCVANGAWSAVTVPDAEGGAY